MAWFDYSIKEAIQHEALRPRLTGDRRDANYPSAASIRLPNNRVVGSCLRSTWYYRKRYPVVNKESIALKRRQELGEMVELKIVEGIKHAGIFENSQIKFYDTNYNISGAIDVAINVPGENVILLAEVKSYYGYYAGKQIEGTKYQKPMPKEQNLLQTMLYLYYFRDRVPGAKLYYVARDSGAETEFNIGLLKQGDRNYAIVGEQGSAMDIVPDYYVEAILERYSILNKFFEANTPPPREYKIKYNDEEMDRYAAAGEFGKIDTANWKKARVDTNRKGDFNCSYCAFKQTCYDPVIKTTGFNWATYQLDPRCDDPTTQIIEEIING